MKNSYATHKFKAVITALTAVLLFVCPVFLAAQTYEIDAVNGQTISTCSGTFYDSGGSRGRYGRGEYYSVAFKSSNGGAIQLDFTNWDVRGFPLLGFSSVMRIYDGIDNSAPLYGTYIGNQDGGSSPGIVRSNNPDNTLYIEFESSSPFPNLLLGAGWEAAISCARSGLLITNPHIYQKVKNN